MTTKEYQIKFSGWHKVTLTGNLMTGDTYPVSGWIKKYLDGKWDATRKGWLVNSEKVAHYTTDSGDTLMVK